MVITRSGRKQRDPIAVMLSPEVFEANTVLGPAIESIWANKFCLNSMFSGADSITRSTRLMVVSNSALESSNFRARSASSVSMSPLSASKRSCRRADSSPLDAPSPVLLTMVAATPPRASAPAIPGPIMPVPTTAAV